MRKKAHPIVVLPRPLLFGLTFISGAAALAYEVVWARYLALVLGQSSHAVLAVLVAFMGGLALGYAAAGRLAERVRQPLAAFGWVEAGIALYALLFVAAFPAAQDLFIAVSRLAPVGGLRIGLNFLFCLLVLLPATALMGATFPFLVKAAAQAPEQLPGGVSAIYAANTLGAACGCLVASFVWIPGAGLDATVLRAAGLNGAVALGALVLARFFERAPASTNRRPPIETARSAPRSELEVRLLVMGAGISGFTAMVYEVGWNRVLALVLGGSPHAFALMLTAFILGMAAGAIVVSRTARLQNSCAVFGWTQLATAISVALSALAYAWLPYVFVRLAAHLPRSAESYPVYLGLQAAVCVSVMILPAAGLGASLPMATGLVAAASARATNAVGSVFALNTLATVAGVLLTGLLFLPALGLAGTLFLGVTLNTLAGLLMLKRKSWAARPAWLALAVPAAVGVVLVGQAVFGDTWRRAFTLGLWRLESPPVSVRAYREHLRENDLRFYRDGTGSTVSVNAFRQGQREFLNLKINGKPDASTAEDMSTQLLLGHVPLVLHAGAADVLVIGLGSGITSAAAAAHPTVTSVDTIEISREVVEAAALFREQNHDVLQHPRVHIVIDDAKAVLRTTARRYDVLISEPSNPWMAGVAGVFTEEFFRHCRQVLRPRGLMVQWLHVYECDDETFQLQLRTFSRVFPHLAIWQSSQADLLLVGSAEPLRPNLETLLAELRQPAVRADLEPVDLANPVAFLALQLISDEAGQFLAPRDGPVHRDMHPVLETFAQRAFFVRDSATLWLRTDDRLSARPTLLLAEYLRQHPLTAADYEALARLHARCLLFPPRLTQSLLAGWRLAAPASPLPSQFAEQLASTSGQTNAPGPPRTSLDGLLESAARDPVPLQRQAFQAMNHYRATRSVLFLPKPGALVSALNRLLETDAPNRRLYQLLQAELAWDQGDEAACLRLGSEAFEPDPSGPAPLHFDLDPSAPRQVLVRMIESCWRSGRREDAWAICEAARTAGFIANPKGPRDPVLEMTYRKVQSAFAPPK